MLVFPEIDPVAIRVGNFLQIHWYGISYLAGFLGAYFVALQRTKRTDLWDSAAVGDLLFYFAVGIILGGRIGYLLFYDPVLIIESPLQLFQFWERGRSFHGGLLGAMLAFYVFCRVKSYSYLQVTDFVAPVAPIGLAFGRLGNFANAELWGKITEVPWGMVFPDAGSLPRHPSQLYEFFLEGVLLFVILMWYASKPRNSGQISGLFMILYGIFRFGVEFFREPDLNIGYLAFEWLTMGQVLSLPMVALGCYVFYGLHNRCNKLCNSI